MFPIGLHLACPNTVKHYLKDTQASKCTHIHILLSVCRAHLQICSASPQQMISSRRQGQGTSVIPQRPRFSPVSSSLLSNLRILICICWGLMRWNENKQTNLVYKTPDPQSLVLLNDNKSLSWRKKLVQGHRCTLRLWCFTTIQEKSDTFKKESRGEGAKTTRSDADERSQVSTQQIMFTFGYKKTLEKRNLEHNLWSK